jgi:hypothetical protein
MCRRVGLVVRDRNDARHDVLEPLWCACLRHLPAELRVVLSLEPVAVAGQRPPHSPAADGPRLPPEHRSVERPRTLRPRRHRVLELPAEETAVEVDRGLRVRLARVHPAGDAGDIALAFRHWRSPLRVVDSSAHPIHDLGQDLSSNSKDGGVVATDRETPPARPGRALARRLGRLPACRGRALRTRSWAGLPSSSRASLLNQLAETCFAGRQEQPEGRVALRA